MMAAWMAVRWAARKGKRSVVRWAAWKVAKWADNLVGRKVACSVVRWVDWMGAN